MSAYTGGIDPQHRPWPVPRRPWLWHQSWHDLLFMHWRVSTSALRAHVPASLTIDEHEGSAWIGLVPFRMTDVRFRGTPALPWLSAFPEMNLRTYVTHNGTPGVWFFRMDASRLAAVVVARMSLALPYVWSAMHVVREGDAIHYRSVHDDAAFIARYEPIGAPAIAAPDSIEAFLVERYCLYTVKRGQLLRVEVHHAPWPLQPAALSIETNNIAEACAMPAASETPHLRFARRLDVIGWGAEAIAT